MVFSMMGIAFFVFLPRFYADSVGIDVLVLGLILIFTRLFDAITDPVVGNLSDSTESKYGRRRPWMFLSAVPLVFLFWLLMNPWDGIGPFEITVITILFFLFTSLFLVPYEALGAELTLNYDERHKLYGIREGALVVGTLLAATFPLIINAFLGIGEDPSDRFQQMKVIGYLYAGLFLLACIVFFIFVHERPLLQSKRPPRSYIPDWRPVIDNKPFRLLLMGYTVSSFGSYLPSTLLPFYAATVLGTENFEVFLLLYLLPGLLFLPFWVWLAGKWEKKQTWLTALTLNTGAFLTVLFLGEGDTLAFSIVSIISGLGMGGVVAIPPSMQADVIDYDEWQKGTRREGKLLGIWAIARKLAIAFGSGIALIFLGAAGYVSGATEQSPATVRSLIILYAGLPSLLNILCAVIIWKYPIDRQSHANLRQEIDEKSENSQAHDT